MTDTLVPQQIRNRVIELLDWLSDESGFDNAISNIEMWGDWVRDNNPETFEQPPFTQEEIVSLIAVSLAWEAITLETKQIDVEWIDFSNKSVEALTVFNKKGFLSET